jgi:hypothetical protein
MVGHVGSNIWGSAASALGSGSPLSTTVSAGKARGGQPPAEKPATGATAPAGGSNQLAPDLQSWMTGMRSSGGDAAGSGADLAQQALRAYARAQ